MKILVTGAAGYIGSVLTQMLLRQGHLVRGLDCLLYGGQSLWGVWSHPGFSFYWGDIRDQHAMEINLATMDAVVHLAAIVGDPACARQKDLAVETNLKASIRLIEGCKKAGVARFIFASTCSNYGKMSENQEYVSENSELRPVSLYAETKVGVEKWILDSTNPSAFSPTILRFATAFGSSPRMRLDLTVNEFAVEMLTKKHLLVYGEQFWRPYVHIRDVAKAICQVLEAPLAQVTGQVFNVGSTDQNYQKKQLVEMILPYAPDAIIEYVHKDEDPRDYRVSFEKIRDCLGFSIDRTVQDGIKELVSMVQERAISDYSDSRLRNDN